MLTDVVLTVQLKKKKSISALFTLNKILDNNIPPLLKTAFTSIRVAGTLSATDPPIWVLIGLVWFGILQSTFLFCFSMANKTN